MSSMEDTRIEFKDRWSEALALYDQKEFSASRLIFENTLESYGNEESKQRDECLFNIASCLASEGNIVKSIELMSEIDDTESSDILYNKALCHYKSLNYHECLHYLDKLLRNIRELYPEFSVKSTDVNLLIKHDLNGLEYSSKLQRSCLIEGINLRAAVLFKLNQNSSILDPLQCLYDLPFNNLAQLDYVTLHNLAIYEHEMSLELSIDKLVYMYEHAYDVLSANSLVPREIYRNLVVLYMKNSQLEIAQEFMRLNKSQLKQTIPEDCFEFLQIQLERYAASSGDLVYSMLDTLLDKALDNMSKEGRGDSQVTVPSAKKSTGEQLAEFILTIVTHQGAILWNNNQYQALEGLFSKVKQAVGHLDIWKKNTAHILYMQDTRYDECSLMYEEFLPISESESLIKVDPMVLGNLCVAYVLIGRNADAESIIKSVEADEAKLVNDDNGDVVDSLTLARQSGMTLWDGRRTSVVDTAPFLVHRDKKLRPNKVQGSHLSIINLVIGTLYCVKYNYDFGLTRIFKTLEPVERKLHRRTWFHVKRCILSLLDCHCKQMICIKDDLLNKIIVSLIQCERYGVLVDTMEMSKVLSDRPISLTEQEIFQFHGRNSVTYESRHLRSTVLSVLHD